MFELLAIMVLANKNAKIAAAKGRKPGSFRALTLGLWFGGELLGFFIGMFATNGETLPAYGIALLFAIIGGLVSYITAKCCKPGEHRVLHNAPLPGARPLPTPCTLGITREKSFVGSLVTYGVYINGQHVGDLKNGCSLESSTNLVQNVIVIKDAYGTEIKPLYFAVPSGGYAEIVFGPQRIISERCRGIVLLSEADVLSFAQDGQVTAAPTASSQPTVSVSTAPYGHASATQALSSLPENPMRAVWVLGVALLFILLSAFLYFPQISQAYNTTTRLVSFSYALALGICLYLMLQRGASYKAISGTGFALSALLRTFTISSLSIRASMGSAPIAVIFRQPGFGSNLLASVITAAAVCTCAVIVSLVRKRYSRERLFIAAWLSAAAAMLVEIFNMRYLFIATNYPVGLKAGIIISNMIIMLSIALFALLIYMLCTLKQKVLHTGVGAKVWFGICTAATLVSAITGIATSAMGITAALVALTGVAAYVLLLASKRIGFPIMLLAVALNVMATFVSALTALPISAGNIITSLAGLINPLITWLIIRNRWNGVSPQLAPKA